MIRHLATARLQANAPASSDCRRARAALNGPSSGCVGRPAISAPCFATLAWAIAVLAACQSWASVGLAQDEPGLRRPADPDPSLADPRPTDASEDPDESGDGEGAEADTSSRTESSGEAGETPSASEDGADSEAAGAEPLGADPEAANEGDAQEDGAAEPPSEPEDTGTAAPIPVPDGAYALPPPEAVPLAAPEAAPVSPPPAAAAVMPAEQPTTAPSQPEAKGFGVDQGQPAPTSDPTVQLRWTNPRPVLTLHGYMRVRGDWQSRFHLGRQPLNGSGGELQGLDLPFSRYRPSSSGRTPIGGCGGSAEGDPLEQSSCNARARSFANMRFRTEPTLAVTEHIRVHSMIDIFDNLVLGSTPDTVVFVPSEDGLARAASPPGTGFPTTAAPPSAYRNSVQDSIVVRRAWAEVGKQGLGELRFGRMGWQWGLGMFANDGSGIDGDFSTDVDRIMGLSNFADFHFAFMYDFLNEGFIEQSTVTRDNFDQIGLPFDSNNHDDADQYVLAVAYRKSEEEQRAQLNRGKAVYNGGLQLIYRKQFLSSDASFNPDNPDGSPADPNDEFAGVGDPLIPSADVSGSDLSRIDMWTVAPDLWFQFILKRPRMQLLRIETEAVLEVGRLDDFAGITDVRNDYTILRFGAALETEMRFLEEKLGVYVNAGFASGDADVKGLSLYENLDIQESDNDGRITNFGFHRNYRIDLILWRNIMGRVAGAYYIKPGVSYDFIRSALGRVLGLRTDLIYSRASATDQTYGDNANLGVELDGTLYFRSEDGPEFTDGFHAMFQYGVLFPLAGLGYTDDQRDTFIEDVPRLRAAQTARLILGVKF